MGPPVVADNLLVDDIAVGHYMMRVVVLADKPLDVDMEAIAVHIQSMVAGVSVLLGNRSVAVRPAEK